MKVRYMLREDVDANKGGYPSSDGSWRCGGMDEEQEDEWTVVKKVVS